MRGKEPAEHLWRQLKQAAAAESGAVTLEQAEKRVRGIVGDVNAPGLPDAALRFYAAEYVRMVKERS
ncbi:MAG TPA: hypothetical protein VFE17_08405 [Candidatus Baltobacteraceae bacterium]|jgi:hypothetical protein|nr:hypothetical protein [Candidatus Baltobacteraceae bacterium]